MGKIALVFPGQGAQFSGMGQSLYETSPAAAKVFDMAESIRPGTKEQCFSGSAEELRRTAVTQPCMLAVELAAAAALTEAGLNADMTAGFSLGELAALSYGGVVDTSTSFRLVCRRGALMDAAAQGQDTAMAAVVKLTPELVEGLCARFPQVYPVNYNCPGQISVACRADQLVPFSAAVKAAGGRALPLKVSGGFHSPFMAQAAAEFEKALEDVRFAAPAIPLYANVTGRPYEGDVKALLAKQICSPVRWEDLIRHMADSGADTFIEAGPGNVLQGLIRKILPEARVYGVSDAESLNNTLREVLV